MSITETVSFDKDGNIERFPYLRKLFLGLVIILVALLSFGIGRLSVGDMEPVKVEFDPALELANVYGAVGTAEKKLTPPSVSAGEVVGSKNSDKYHYLYCPGAGQIKESNKIVFNSPEAAQAAGYTLAGNCNP